MHKILRDRKKNFLFSDTVRGAGASAAIYSIVVTARPNGLNQRAYTEWLLAEMPNDARLSEPGRIDRYLPWSDDVPEACRLVPRGKIDEDEVLPDEPGAFPGVIGKHPTTPPRESRVLAFAPLPYSVVAC